MAQSGMDSRLAAHELLHAVLKQNKTLDAAMDELPKLADSDKGLAYRQAKTVLRYKLAFDGLLTRYLDNPLDASRFDITCCLYLGMAQILLLETPVHAAVNTSVELAKYKFPKMKGLVNAVLKKIADDKDTIILTAKDATPPWLWENWVAAHGRKITEQFAAHHLHEPPLDVTWSQPLPQAELLAGGTQRLPKGVGFAELEGTGWAQDVAASIPVKLLGDVKGLRVLDACAAPGGKTMQLAAAGANVTAVDISANRLKRLKENLAHNALSAEVICADLKKWQPQQKFDIIVLDSPCSATGTLRRHPEILYQRTPKDVARLVEIQRELLAKALTWLAPEGKLLYITCSLQKEEGEGQMEAYASRIIPFKAGTANVPPYWITKQGYYRSLPHYLDDKGGMDGFFAALISA